MSQQKVIQLYNGPAPGSENWNWEEKETAKNPMKFKIIYNVTRPTLTIYSPDTATVNGSAIIVFPGGGFRVLNIEHEGTNVAKELTKKGFTVFVLQYRVRQSFTDDPWEEMINSMKDKEKFTRENVAIKKLALDDAITAIKYVRLHAANYKIKPNRIGMIGFSAGGFLSRNMACHNNPELRPDFAAAIYGGLPSSEKLSIPSNAPPLFIAGATDDALLSVANFINLYNTWVASKQSAELHLYAKGGHGLRIYPGNTWILRYFDWLKLQGLMK
jgi:acetyl esterase/lipase